MEYNNVKNEYNYLLNFYSKEKLENYAKGNDEKIKSLYIQCQPKEVPIGDVHEILKDSSYKTYVDSPDSWVSVLDCIEKTKTEMYKVTLEDKEISCSYDHLFQKYNDEWISARALKVGDILLSNDKINKVVDIEVYYEDTQVYDLSVEHENHRYYTEGISSHNTGKSLFLQNHCINHWKDSLNVVMITLELNPELAARRMDSMLLELSTSELYEDLNNTAIAIQHFQRNSNGSMKLKYMPSGSKTSEIKNFLKQYITETGTHVDVLVVDYLDLVEPIGKYSTGDQFGKDKLVSEDLRNIGQEMGTLIITASQVNRGGYGQEELDHSHIAGGISKINTADLVLGIISNNQMREQGEYNLQILKSRNSQGTGKKIPLSFNTRCMKISDDPDYLSNINTYSNYSVTKANQMLQNTDVQKQLNEIQNALVSDSSTDEQENNKSHINKGSDRLANIKNLIDKSNR